MTKRAEAQATTKRVEQLNALIQSGVVVKAGFPDGELPVERFSYEGGDFFKAHFKDTENTFSFGIGHKHEFKIEVGQCVYSDCIAC